MYNVDYITVSSFIFIQANKKSLKSLAKYAQVYNEY